VKQEPAETDEEADEEMGINQEMEVDETHQATEAAPDQSNGDARPDILSRL
jgi:hypothetical protein